MLYKAVNVVLLHLDDTIKNEMINYGLSSPTAEVCGAFLGKRGKDNRWIVKEFIPIENVCEDQSRYIPHPEQWLSAIKQTTLVEDNADLDFIGVYHTHPMNTPTPSITDIAYAAYEGVYIIYSPVFSTFSSSYWSGDPSDAWVPILCDNLDYEELKQETIKL